MIFNNTFDLLTHTSQNDVIAWRKGKPIVVSQFLADVATLAEQLPTGGHMLNICRDRYHFAVGFAAAILTGKVSLLPPTHTPDMVRQLQSLFPDDVFCLHDQKSETIDLPCFRYSLAQSVVGSGTQYSIPRVSANQLVALVFTSGSTGAPVPHPKHWGLLVRNVQAQQYRLGLKAGVSYSIVGTIPAQHMYGFESTILLALQSGNAFSCEQPFYPADICTVVASVPAPRLIVSTPLHMRLLMDSHLPLAPAALLLSATAALSAQLASKVEEAFQAPLLEIYGSTETGQIATRRTTQTAQWQLFPSVRLVEKDGSVWAEGGHVSPPVPLNDVIELVPNALGYSEFFLLHGRLQDLINIAGKRTSLANLDYHLNSIPGVVDGAFYMPDENGSEHVTRLCACVQAPQLSTITIMAELRARVDAVFLPRPLLFVPSLPRNSTGKLPRDILRRFIESQAALEFVVKP